MAGQEEMFTISKARDKEDFDNMCLQPSDGGSYPAAKAITILENGSGGAINRVKGGQGYLVSYDKSQNTWLKDELKIK